ncbi:hypothetical protein [Streptomyces sp. NPDC127039]|uniref:hypothetical protein n=1 Tax=Streptomyces sp. NPDC127039 TaxID=3347115 RepID=UPI0036483CD6
MAQGSSASGKAEVGTEAEAAKAVADAADAKGKVLATAHIKYTHKGGPYDVESWKQGESHVFFCETYVIPAGATSGEVHWSEEDGEPHVWKFPQK